ncbi:MAG: hypothetical protein HGA19_21725, partial [Oscillochloris sp.]|nr:hypothetical protein [Oscillochloris sp.]
GHLIISGGPNARSINEWLPVALQAATVGESQQIDDRALADLIEAAGPGKLAAAQLTPLPGGITAGPAEAPAWVSRSFGKGKVTQLAFDPGLPMLQSWAKAPDFWNAFLQPALQVSTSFGYQTNADIIQEQFLASALTALPTVNQPPVDLFFLILIIYTILIGPVLALGLRRIDRQSWSWLIVPVVAIGSGSLLLTIAINLQADSRMITQINLIEYLGNDQARARAYVGILAPQQQTLTVNLPTEALTRPVISIKGLFSEIRGISGPIGQEQERLPINVDAWTLEGFVAEHQITLPGIDSKIVVNDQGALVELQNGTEQKLIDVVAVYGEQVVWLGDILPGEKVNGHWPPTLNLAPPGTMLSSIIFSDALNEAQLPGQATERRLKARISMIDAAVVHTATDTDPGPMILAWMESSPLNVDVEVPSAARQNLTLLVIHPHITGSGTIALPQDWLRVDSTNEQQAACFSSEGTGVAASPDPVTIMLHVPADLAPLRASKLTLNINSSDTWPNAGVITELYSWKNADWVEQQFDGPGDLNIVNPAEYLFQGRVLLRLSGAIPRAKCLYIHTRLQGSLP